jgi:capsular polysaccharide transport system permease protein
MTAAKTPGTAATPRPALRPVDTTQTPAPGQDTPVQEQKQRNTPAQDTQSNTPQDPPDRHKTKPVDGTTGTKPAPSGNRTVPRKGGPAKRKRPPQQNRRKRPRSAPTPAQAAARPRHYGTLAAFVLLVLLPFLVWTWYLYERAVDQYHSEVAFSIRSEEMGSSTAGLLGALTQMNTGSASDADILFEYIRSQQIVEKIDSVLDLRQIWGRPDGDPIFALGDNPSIEALHAYWLRMVEVGYDAGTGIIQVQARAFTPEDAQDISREVLAESSALVNLLSEQARSDAVGLAEDELGEAEEVVRRVRKDLADFRRQYNIVDPSADVAGQSGLLNALQQELAQALVDRDVLLSYAADTDQRVVQANRRIAAITGRIEEERSSLDLTGIAGSLPEVVGRYEELVVNLEFANTAFTQALGGLAAARAEARRQSRYLAPHVEPTLAEESLYPRRLVLAGLAGFFLLIGWMILSLVYYNIRDNR